MGIARDATLVVRYSNKLKDTLPRRALNSLSIFIIGSIATKADVEGSDIDLCLVVKTTVEPSLIELVRVITSQYFPHSPQDFTVIKENEFFDKNLCLTNHLLWREVVLSARLKSLHVYGKDIRQLVQIPSFERYLSLTLAMPIQFMSRARASNVTSLSICYPDGTDYYFGYIVRTNPNPLKLIVSIVGWIATGIIAKRAKIMVGSKSSVAELYKVKVGGEWSSYISHVFSYCRADLGYELPESMHQKQIIRKICKRLIYLERYYVINYFSENSEK